MSLFSVLTINVPVEISSISLDVINQVVNIQCVLRVHISFISDLKDSNFDISR